MPAAAVDGKLRAVLHLLYSPLAADDVILKAPACRGPKNLLFPWRMEIQRKADSSLRSE